jgi:hypothetical protein
LLFVLLVPIAPFESGLHAFAGGLLQRFLLTIAFATELVMADEKAVTDERRASAIAHNELVEAGLSSEDDAAVLGILPRTHRGNLARN